jgi:hypothetical protein
MRMSLSKEDTPDETPSSDSIKIEQTPEKAEPLITPITPDDKAEPQHPPQEKTEAVRKLEDMSKEILLKIGWRSAGELAAGLTQYDGWRLTEEELGALVEAWKPFLPEMPNWMFAAIATLTIWGKKTAMYAAHKKKQQKTETPSPTPDKGGNIIASPTA